MHENVKIIEEHINKESIAKLCDIYKQGLVRHPYLHPVNLYLRKLHLGWKFKVLEVKDQGYLAFMSHLLYNRLFLPGIFDELDLYYKVYTIARKRKFLPFYVSGTTHFYVDSEAVLSIYEQTFNGLAKEGFIDVVYDDKVRWSKQSRHRIHINLKKAKENGVKVDVLKQIDVDTFKEWYSNCYVYAYDGNPPFTYSQLHRYTEGLLEEGLEKFIVATIDDKVVGGFAVLMDEYSNVAWYNLGAVCRDGRDVGAGYLLVTTAIDLVKEQNKVLELYGKGLLDRDPKHEGIFNFKRVFGREVEIPYFYNGGMLPKLLNTVMGVIDRLARGLRR